MKQCNNTTMCNRLLRNRGFTLIELIIYSGILVVVLTFTGEYLYSIGQARINNAARVEVAQAAELIINKVRSDVTGCLAILNPTGSEPSPNLNITIDENTIIYSLSDSTINRSVGGVVDRLSSNQVRASDLVFNKIANPGGIITIQIRFTLTSLAQLSGGRNVQESFQTTFSQR